MKGKTEGKIISIVLICVLLAFDILFLGIKVVKAVEEYNNQEVQEEVSIGFDQMIEKYYQLGDNQILLQQNVVVYLAEENVEKETENLEIEAPTLEGEKPEVVTCFVNGKKMNNEYYQYNSEAGIVTIQADKQKELEDWGKQEDSYKIIYGYFDIEEKENQSIQLSTKIDTKILEEDWIHTQGEKIVEINPVGESISVQAKATEEIYKGYLYQAEKQNITSYIENYQIEISNMQNVEEIIVTNQNTAYVYEEDGEQIRKDILNNDIYYSYSMFNKENILELLGEEGEITIQNENGEEVAKITNETQTNENGNIIIEYPEDNVHYIQIKVTKPIQEGTLKIYNRKELKAQTAYSEEELKKFQYIEETIQANESTQEVRINLKEPTLQADLEISKQELSSIIENKEVEFKVTLKASDNTAFLYQNPVIEIVMPEEVERISLSSDVNLLYENEMQIKNAYSEGKNIYIELEGEQTTYKEDAIGGAEISFKADINLNNQATSNTKQIVMNVRSGENATSVLKDIDIVFPRELVTVNNIEELGIETIGEEKQTEVVVNTNSEEKEVKVESKIINNNEATINNVIILGDMPTDTEDNNLGATITTPVEVEGVEATVYYTQNENATIDLNNKENAWTQETEQINESKKYLVEIDTIENAQVVNFSYGVALPASLEYNQLATQGYQVSYTNSETAVENNATSTYITMTTGEGPVVEGTISAKVGQDILQDGSSVKIGEVIRYQVDVKNTGTEDTTNIMVTADIPEGTVLVKPKEDFEYTIEDYYDEIEQENYQATIETLAVGETESIIYEVRVKDDTTVGTSLVAKAQIDYDDVSKQTDEITAEVENANLKVIMKRRSDVTEIPFRAGESITYHVIVKNISETTQENVKVNLNLPDCLQLSYYDINQEYMESEGNQINVGTIESSSQKVIIVYVKSALNEEDNEVELSAIAFDSNGIQYRSNVYSDMVYGKNVDVKFSANDENEYMKTDDKINYQITITNKGSFEINSLNITQIVPEDLTIFSVSKNGEELQYVQNSSENEYSKEENVLSFITGIDAGESITYDVETIVNYSDTRVSDKTITSKLTVTTLNEILQEIEISHMLQKEENSSNVDNPDNPDNPSNPGDTNTTFTIQGKAWLDKDSNGAMQTNESGIQGIGVKLLNVETNQLVKDQNGNVLSTTTDINGEYSLMSLSKGRYIVIFEYDVTQYKLTTYQKEGVADSNKSKAIARKLDIGSGEKTYGATDVIEIIDRGISNINIGLVRMDEFNLKLDKYISRVIVQSSKTTQTQAYQESSLAKVEIDAKNLSGSNIIIEYTIKVTNIGEVDGYVKKIVDYLPEGFKFSSELNKDWYQANQGLSNVSLANEKISAGESRTVTLTLTKAMNENATGTYTNIAEIAESYNELGLDDVNSTPGNKKQGEDDINSADIVISIRTGRMVLYITLIASCVVTIATGVYFIKKKILDEKI